MVNNRGWLRIVEASAAVLIIFSVILLISRQAAIPQSNDLTGTITPILEEIARNSSLREDIITYGNESVPQLREFVGSRIKLHSLNYEVAVCNVDEICSLVSYPSNTDEIYTGERIISSTLTSYNPKKVKIFLWRTVT